MIIRMYDSLKLSIKLKLKDNGFVRRMFQNVVSKSTISKGFISL